MPYLIERIENPEHHSVLFRTKRQAEEHLRAMAKLFNKWPTAYTGYRIVYVSPDGKTREVID